eukprot:5665736-Pyramimonas_sp.AAC.2
MDGSAVVAAAVPNRRTQQVYPTGVFCTRAGRTLHPRTRRRGRRVSPHAGPIPLCCPPNPILPPDEPASVLQIGVTVCVLNAYATHIRIRITTK